MDLCTISINIQNAFPSNLQSNLNFPGKAGRASLDDGPAELTTPGHTARATLLFARVLACVLAHVLACVPRCPGGHSKHTSSSGSVSARQPALQRRHSHGAPSNHYKHTRNMRVGIPAAAPLETHLGSWASFPGDGRAPKGPRAGHDPAPRRAGEEFRTETLLRSPVGQSQTLPNAEGALPQGRCQASALSFRGDAVCPPGSTAPAPASARRRICGSCSDTLGRVRSTHNRLLRPSTSFLPSFTFRGTDTAGTAGFC